MNILIHPDPAALGDTAGKEAARLIKEAIAKSGRAHIILATGTSQFETLRELMSDKDIAWDKVIMFHLDEYIGLSDQHPASFRKYLRERFLEKVPPLRAAHLIDGEGDAVAECERLGMMIAAHPIDVALVGIGENGHLAFNDPPADFDIPQPYIVVQLDDQCVAQQYGEGWFKSLDEVPRQAISMSIRQIMKSRNIICSVPDGRKAKAVHECLDKSVSNRHPASILQRHPNCTIYLDKASASQLQRNS
ncbi:glucosamine-6-phosphate deaminase [Chryseolinea sp. T2]|uniref:glucosamine-6-phosphate deaminase n=1 Tax=Chryseolinea sp. T2 TaxID=3129255 RepID=UPI00307691F5